eukprot:CAMPEP_0172890176 /NCGR_PEP_ID=MMETSP1075-20121228/140583_1 /TAXON_ID=2916 /ORGANISM="Ceratium fusus, Strain PA161109" /LENGTH=66 /DNA_ID=CAMNT_0013744385 /DNA_START=289 /DNA_END=486 /DNA_ORIENTATION=-
MATATWRLLEAAWNKGVRPSWSLSLGSARFASNKSICSTWPSRAASAIFDSARLDGAEVQTPSSVW